VPVKFVGKNCTPIDVFLANFLKIYLKNVPAIGWKKIYEEIIDQMQ